MTDTKPEHRCEKCKHVMARYVEAGREWLDCACGRVPIADYRDAEPTEKDLQEWDEEDDDGN